MILMIDFVVFQPILLHGVVLDAGYLFHISVQCFWWIPDKVQTFFFSINQKINCQVWCSRVETYKSHRNQVLGDRTKAK